MDRIFAGQLRQFVDHRFDGEIVVPRTDAAPSGGADAALFIDMLGGHCRDIVVRHFRTGHDDMVDALLRLHPCLTVEIRYDRVGGDAVAPAGDLACPIESDVDLLRRHRPQATRSNIVLTAQQHFYRLADRFRQQHGIDSIFDKGAPAEAAAHGHEVEFHLVGRHARRLGRIVPRPRRPLRAAPDFDAI